MSEAIVQFVTDHPYWVLVIGAVCYGSMIAGLLMAQRVTRINKED